MLINNNIEGNGSWVDLSDLGAILTSKSVPATPEIDISDSGSISKRKIFLNNSYTHRDFSLEVYLTSSSNQELQTSLINITSALRGEFSIRFKDNPSLVYRNVHLSNKIDVENIGSTILVLSIKLTAYDPFKYSLEKKITKLVDITSDTLITVVNEGNHTAKPIIKIKGSASKLNITTNGKTLSYVNLQVGNDIVINNSNYTVVDKKPGGDVSALVNWRDNFIELVSGENIIYITGDNIKVDVEIEFRDTYL